MEKTGQIIVVQCSPLCVQKTAEIMWSLPGGLQGKGSTLKSSELHEEDKLINQFSH